jgi:hypothetical protein
MILLLARRIARETCRKYSTGYSQSYSQSYDIHNNLYCKVLHRNAVRPSGPSWRQQPGPEGPRSGPPGGKHSKVKAGGECQSPCGRAGTGNSAEDSSAGTQPERRLEPANSRRAGGLQSEGRSGPSHLLAQQKSDKSIAGDPPALLLPGIRTTSGQVYQSLTVFRYTLINSHNPHSGDPQERRPAWPPPSAYYRDPNATSITLRERHAIKYRADAHTSNRIESLNESTRANQIIRVWFLLFPRFSRP